jgi:uncharacterized protein
MYIHRQLEQAILRASEYFSVVMVTGPRQSGKTTLLRHLSATDRQFVTLDDPQVRALAQGDPELFIRQFRPPLFIDEFQYAPDLLSLIKIQVDKLRTVGRNEEAAGMYWLTGSQHFSLMRNVRESLAGRVAIFDLLGFSPYELAQPTEWIDTPFFEQAFDGLPAVFPASAPQTSTDPTDVFRRIITGSMPDAVLGNVGQDDLNRYYGSYVQTYLERDVAALDGVRNLRQFELFYRLLAGRVGQLLNYASIANEVGVSVNTVKEWTYILMKGFQVYVLSPYFRSFSKRLVKTPKLYFTDSGLQAYLSGWTDPATALTGPLAGQMFENWVVGSLLRSYWHRGRREPLYFWRTRTGGEIDLWVAGGGIIHAAQIKLSSRAKESHFAPLRQIDPAPERFGRKVVLSLTERPLQITADLWNVPATLIN